MVFPRIAVRRIVPSIFTSALKLYHNVGVKSRKAGGLNAGSERNVGRGTTLIAIQSWNGSGE